MGSRCLRSFERQARQGGGDFSSAGRRLSPLLFSPSVDELFAVDAAGVEEEEEVRRESSCCARGPSRPARGHLLCSERLWTVSEWSRHRENIC